MRRWALILIACCAGCTNAPLAGFLDTVAPSKVGRELDPGDRGLNDPLGPGSVPPPPGGRLLGPGSPPGGSAPGGTFSPSSGSFNPPLSPPDSTPLPPPAPGGSPFRSPNT